MQSMLGCRNRGFNTRAVETAKVQKAACHRWKAWKSAARLFWILSKIFRGFNSENVQSCSIVLSWNHKCSHLEYMNTYQFKLYSIAQLPFKSCNFNFRGQKCFATYVLLNKSSTMRSLLSVGNFHMEKHRGQACSRVIIHEVNHWRLHFDRREWVVLS